MLYVLAFNQKSRDWDNVGDRIAFRGADLVRGFEPQFHHIFPSNFLKGKATEDNINALANIAVIGATVNIKISNKDPLDYFLKYGIDESKRVEQFINGDVTSMTPANFPDWLTDRAKRLADASNKFLEQEISR